MAEELIKQFESKFAELKKDLKFKTSLQDLEEIFFLKDFILKEGFVSPQLSRQIARRIVDTYMNWYGYLHGIIMPNPGSLPSIGESQIFNEEEKHHFMQLMSLMIAISSNNALTGLTKDKKEEAKFFDDSVSLFKTKISPTLISVMKKVNEHWNQKAKAPLPKPQKQEQMFG